MGLAVWVEDEAGPYQTVPYPGESWQLESHPAHQPHEYIRNGTAKCSPCFIQPAGRCGSKGSSIDECDLTSLAQRTGQRNLKTLPEKPILDEETNRQAWEAWQQGLSKRITLAEKLPPLRMLLIWDNLRGHYTSELVLWLFAHGVMPLYTPLGGSWLNMAESIQRILVRRGLAGQTPQYQSKSLAGWKRSPEVGMRSQPHLNGVVHELLAENEVESSARFGWLWCLC